VQAGPAVKTSLGAPNGQVVVVNEVSADVMQDSVAIRFPAVIIGVMPYWWRERGGQRCLINCLALRPEAYTCGAGLQHGSLHRWITGCQPGYWPVCAYCRGHAGWDLTCWEPRMLHTVMGVRSGTPARIMTIPYPRIVCRVLFGTLSSKLPRNILRDDWDKCQVCRFCAV